MVQPGGERLSVADKRGSRLLDVGTISSARILRAEVVWIDGTSVQQSAPVTPL